MDYLDQDQTAFSSSLILSQTVYKISLYHQYYYDKDKGLNLSITQMTQEASVDSIDQDQTAQNVQSDLWSTLSTFFILDYN